MKEQRQKEVAFEELLRTHRAIIFKIVSTYCWQPEDRADLAQEIAAQLWLAWPRYDPSRSAFTTWMYRIAFNVAISFVRKEVRHRRVSVPLDEEVHDTATTIFASTVDEDRVARLQRFIERQPPLDRALLLLYLDEKPQKEIAEILGLTQTNISTKIGRLKLKIRNEL
jgi:RNA polymerase sigma-70 factor (ECF subfamily)